MADKTLKILAVCGSGVVSSSMITTHVKEILGQYGIKVDAFGLMPQMVKSYVDRGDVDLIVSTTKIPGEIDVPIINAVALLSGIGEDEFTEELVSAARRIIEEKGKGG